MAAILNFNSRPTSDKVVKVIFMSGMVENMVVEVGIAAQSVTVEKLFFTSGLAVAILNFGNAILISGNQPTSGNVGSARDVSGMVGNVGVAIGIVSPAHCVQ